jgi:porin
MFFWPFLVYSISLSGLGYGGSLGYQLARRTFRLNLKGQTGQYPGNASKRCRGIDSLIKAIQTITLAVMVEVMTVSVQASAEADNPSSPEIVRGSARINSELNSFRSKLKDYGLTVQLTYISEAFHSFNLIPNNETRYRGLVDLYIKLDTGQSGLWPDGEFFIYGQNGHGKGFVVNPAGDALPISNIDARDFTQISQFGFQQGLLGRKAQIRLGKQDVNAIFDVNEFGGDFIFPAYTLIPTVPMPTFPAPALGTSLFVKPADRLSLGVGIYDGAPKIESLGFDTTFDDKGGYFSIIEAAWKPGFGAQNRYPGNYRFGLWHHSGEFAATGDKSDSKTFSDNYGFYLMFDQLVFKEQSTGDNDQGLGIFFQFGWAPSDRNPLWRYVGAGFSYKGFLEGREHDTLGVGLNYSWLVDDDPAADSRTHLANIEVFYILRLTSWLSLQPDIQYYDNPGENGTAGFAAGLRWILRF